MHFLFQGVIKNLQLRETHAGHKVRLTCKYLKTLCAVHPLNSLTLFCCCPERGVYMEVTGRDSTQCFMFGMFPTLSTKLASLGKLLRPLLSGRSLIYMKVWRSAQEEVTGRDSTQ